MKHFLLSLFILSIASPAMAQSYDELMRRTQSSLNDYMQQQPTAIMPAAAPPAPVKIIPSAPTLLNSPPKETPVATLGKSEEPATNTSYPLLTGQRIERNYHGVRQEHGMTVVTYTFGGDIGRDKRMLNSRERDMVRNVLARELPYQVGLRFDEAGQPETAYLRIAAADLLQGKSGGVLGYASYPHPLGSELVLDQTLCKPEATDCELLQGVVRHEIGHTLGLRHPQDANKKWHGMKSIMQASASREQTKYQPHDIASLQQLYGVAPGAKPLQADATVAVAQVEPKDAAPAGGNVLASLGRFLQETLWK